MVQLVSAGDFHSSDDHLSNMDLYCQQRASTVCRLAVLKKVKTNKHKFFVLHKDSTAAPSRLEYYDSESHWNKKKKAKRTIYLKTLFSINAFTNLKVKYGMTIFTKDDSFQIGFESEQSRDMWLADIRLLSHASVEQTRSAVNQTWSVQVETRGVKQPLQGNFTLTLTEKLASLESKVHANQICIFPLEVIVRCSHQGKYCVLEVNNMAAIGAGKIWLLLEDSLIAQHVCKAFEQNKLISTPDANTFRPVSRSLSYKDRHTAYRIRTGSDARQRYKGQGFQKLGHMSSTKLASSSSTCFQRDRSDSIGSHSTTASQSTDESECCQSWNSRSTTPDPRAELQSHHLAMIIRNGENDYRCLSREVTNESPDSCYADMTGRPQDKNSNFVYVDMSGSHNLPYIDMQQLRSSDYIDMTAGGCSPNYKGYKVRPESVKCYLRDDENQPKPASSPVSRNHASPAPHNTDEYVEMCGRQRLTGKDKSSSAPHLLPTIPCQQKSADQLAGNDIFMNIDFDNRNRAASISYAHRPRGSSWSQFIRPRSSTTDHKRRTSRKCKTNNNSADCLNSATDYMDMRCGLPLPEQDSYVEMSLDKQSKHRLALVNNSEREDKENYVPCHQSPAPRVSHPFPQLLFTSSEDDVSLHSMEGSISLHSLTSSADSMSTSSHSSHHSSSALTTQLDAEAYVAMHPVPSTAFPKCTSHRLLMKPTKVTSYIVDDTSSDNNSGSRTDYMEMGASNSSRTKQ